MEIAEILRDAMKALSGQGSAPAKENNYLGYAKQPLSL